MNPPAVIRVSADHIARATPRCGDNCPIALAVRDLLSQDERYVHSVWVDASNIEAEVEDFGTLTADLPKAARSFVARFDLGMSPVKPFRFTVEWLDQDGVGVTA